MEKNILIKDNGSLEIIDQSVCINSILKMNDTIETLSGKWKIPVIILLSFGPRRFNSLLRELGKITPRSLSKELKFLEENMLIEKCPNEASSSTPEYRITDHGMSLTLVLNHLKQWGDAHRKIILNELKKASSIQPQAI